MGLLVESTGAAEAFTGAGFDVVRTPNVVKSVVANAAGSTAVWVPAAGKRFRLMRFLLELTNNASLAVAGVLTVALLDAAAGINVSFGVFVPGAAGAAVGVQTITPGWVDIGNGVLSGVANNTLNVNLSVALVTGQVSVFTAGVEE